MDARPAPRQPKPIEAWRWCAAGPFLENQQIPPSCFHFANWASTNSPISLRACWTPWSVFQDGSGRSLVVNAATTWPCSRASQQPPLLAPPSRTLPVKQHQSTVRQPTEHCAPFGGTRPTIKPTAPCESAEPALVLAIQNSPYGLLPTRGTGLPPRQPPRRYEASKYSRSRPAQPDRHPNGKPAGPAQNSSLTASLDSTFHPFASERFHVL